MLLLLLLLLLLVVVVLQLLLHLDSVVLPERGFGSCPKGKGSVATFV